VTKSWRKCTSPGIVDPREREPAGGQEADVADDVTVVLGHEVPHVLVAQQRHQRSSSAEADGGVHPPGANDR
jgi:hypothetical protein